MSWLRIDDGAPDHPKLLALTRAQRWTWIELLAYCASARTGGDIPEGIRERVPNATPAFLRRLLELELLDADAEGGLSVHDWSDYNRSLETAARRQKRYRMRRAGVPEEKVLEAAPLALPDDIPFERYVTHPVTDDASTRARLPSPSPRSTSTPTEQKGRGEGLNTSNELHAARLVGYVSTDSKRDYVRGACRRLPEAVPARILEELAGARVSDREAYVLGALRRELEALEAGR